MREIKMTPPSTETPKSEMNPTADEMLKLVPVSSSAITPPVNAHGIVPSSNTASPKLRKVI